MNTWQKKKSGTVAFGKGKVDTICISLLRDVGPTAQKLYLSDLCTSYLYKPHITTLSPLQHTRTWHNTPLHMHWAVHPDDGPGPMDKPCKSDSFAGHVEGQIAKDRSVGLLATNMRGGVENKNNTHMTVLVINIYLYGKD